jgi:hypothetical protein
MHIQLSLFADIEERAWVPLSIGQHNRPHDGVIVVQSIAVTRVTVDLILFGLGPRLPRHGL